MKKHILVISQYFYPEEFRINDICKEWIKRGYEVTVLTGIPNYPKGDFYEGYGIKSKRKERWNGISIIRIPIVPRKHGAIMLSLNYISFVISGFFWKTFTKVRAEAVFIFQMSPMTQALVGIWYAKKHKVPCYIYVQDLWPDSVEAITGIRNTQVIGLLDKMVNYVYKNCDVILGTSPSFVKEIEKRKVAWNEEGKSKVRYWPQYAEEFYVPVTKEPLEDLLDDDTFKIIFTGNIGYAQGLSILPRVAECLKKRTVKCEFVIVGDGRYREEFEKDIAARNVEGMFKLLGRKLPEEIPQYLAHCDLTFLSFAESQLFAMTLPAKLQSYMACGKAILAVAGGETRNIIEESGCGIVCNFENEQEVANAIQYCIGHPNELESMGRNALKYNANSFEKKKLLDQIQKYLDL